MRPLDERHGLPGVVLRGLVREESELRVSWEDLERTLCWMVLIAAPMKTADDWINYTLAARQYCARWANQ